MICPVKQQIAACQRHEYFHASHVQNARCEMRSAKCEIGVAIAIANVDAMPSCIRLPPPLYLLSPPLQPPSLLLSTALSETRAAISEWQLCSAFSEPRTAMSEWQFSSILASFPTLADYPSVKLTSLGHGLRFGSPTRKIAFGSSTIGPSKMPRKLASRRPKVIKLGKYYFLRGVLCFQYFE